MNKRKLIFISILVLIIIFGITIAINHSLGTKIDSNNKEISKLKTDIESTTTSINSYNNFIDSLSDDSSAESVYKKLTNAGDGFAAAEEDYINAVIKFRKDNPDATASYIPDNDKVMKNLRKYVNNDVYEEIKSILWYDKPCKVSFDSKFELEGNKFNVVWTVWDDNEVKTVVTGKYDRETNCFEDISVHWLDR